MICHKVDGLFGIGSYKVICGTKELPYMSYSEWEKVTCDKCIYIGIKEGKIDIKENIDVKKDKA